ncbi:hypothetical protein SAMN02745126_01881 [Enhydrobacter aerosaccus]|uniref:Alpha/beta hydrolase family protein n=1 Tax=Enhydrobacter aerosaccus TaxID=225324 RepID=A0A1T4MMU1_9HYPH|nr:alpha/beta hydrolase [Enhydrobacter aerosaccus]SJZ68191.1 hypothetical protein SAMN02745126_01881 [Enhydrobacter aerosaccus]
MRGLVAAIAVTMALATPAWSQATPPRGEIKGTATSHTPESAANVIAQASVALPAQATGGAAYFGKWKDMPQPAASAGKVPVVVFLHGSSGLGLAAIAEWQKWLAAEGIASVAPDSFALPDRLTYSSPIGKDVYERIHALRASEITLALKAVRAAQWADEKRLVLAGTSEGATAVARYGGAEFAARMIFSWSCEDNYFVEAHGTQLVADQPVLNMISSVDPFFSPANAWLGNPAAKGNCAAALAGSKRAVIVLIPGAPHTLITLPYAKAMTQAFLQTSLAR